MRWPDYNDIKEECDAIIASRPNDKIYTYLGRCPQDFHTEICPMAAEDDFDVIGAQRVEDFVAEASRVKKNLKRLQLLGECALKPSLADDETIDTLDGMDLKNGPTMNNK